MPIRYSTYNDPNIGALFDQTAQALAPPAPGELASLATAGLTNQKKAQLADLFANPNQPNFDRRNIVVGNYAPTQSFYAQDQNNATTQRGQDVTAQTSIANNQNTVRGSTIADLFGPLNQGQIRPDVPSSVASSIGLPQLPAVAGAPKPLSETEAKGGLLAQILPLLTPDQQKAIALQGADTTNVVGANGQPEVVWTQNAVGLQPAYAPNKETVTTNEGYGQPPPDMAWVRAPDGSIKTDDRGVPLALPIKGTKTFSQQEAAAKAGASKASSDQVTTSNVNTVIDDVISKIKANPAMTTGLGAQLTAAIGGSPAMDVASQLQTLRSNGSFDELQKLRDNSPTGGALGQISDKEEQMLASVIAALNQEQSADQLLQNLDRLKQVRYDIVNGPGAFAKAQTLQAGGSVAGGAMPESSGPAVGTVDGGYRFNGGDPGDPNNWSQAQ